MSELTLRDKMKLEALARMELLNTSSLSRAKFLNDVLTKNEVDFDEMIVNENNPLTEEEEKMVRDFENNQNALVFYVIKDVGRWPDGCPFPRYTLLYVSHYEEEWEMDKEDAIKLCKTHPAYVINMEEPSCSEITEFGFLEAAGTIINAT